MPGALDLVSEAMLRHELAERLLRDLMHEAIREQEGGDHPRRRLDQWERRQTLDRTIAALQQASEDLLAALQQYRAELDLEVAE